MPKQIVPGFRISESCPASSTPKVPIFHAPLSSRNQIPMRSNPSRCIPAKTARRQRSAGDRAAASSSMMAMCSLCLSMKTAPSLDIGFVLDNFIAGHSLDNTGSIAGRRNRTHLDSRNDGRWTGQHGYAPRPSAAVPPGWPLRRREPGLLPPL